MSNQKHVPEGTVSRLCIYLRELTELKKRKIDTISSTELGEKLNLNDAQVRKDLGYFGQFGVTGSGYDVHELKTALEKILGKDKTWNVAIVGVGHLGSALLAYPGFKAHGLEIVAAFDTDIRKINKKWEGLTIQAIDELEDTTRKRNVTIGIITVPAKEAQGVADELIKCNIKCILNFAPMTLDTPEDVKIRDVDLSRELEMLSFFLVNSKQSGNFTDIAIPI